MTALDFDAMFSSYVGSLTKDWKYDRNQTLGASEVFGCIRKAWFQKNGTEKDPNYTESWGATHRGDLIENHLVVPAVRHGLRELVSEAKLLGAGDKQSTLLSKSKLNSATPDGLIVNLKSDALSNYGVEDIESDCILFEIKSIDPRVNLREEKAIHAGQCQQQLGIVRERTTYKPMYAVILYVDASFHDNLKVFTVKFDDKKWKAAQTRAELLFRTTDPGRLRPEGKFDDSCKYCPFTQACAAATIGTLPPKKDKNERDVMESAPEDVALKTLVSEHDAAKRAEAEAKAEKERKAQDIKDHLQAAKRRGVRHDTWSVSWFSQGGNSKLDKDRLAEDLAKAGMKLEDYQIQGAGFDKLVVSVKDDFNV